jgi:hypothetical protein
VVVGQARELGEEPVAPAVVLLAMSRVRLLGVLQGLIAAVEHGEQPGAAELQPRRSRLCEQAVDKLERFVRRPRSEAQGDPEVRRERARATGEPAVAVRLQGCGRPFVGAATRVRYAEAEGGPDAGEPQVILCLLESSPRVEQECSSSSGKPGTTMRRQWAAIARARAAPVSSPASPARRTASSAIRAALADSWT